MAVELRLVTQREFARIRTAAPRENDDWLCLVADMCRLNALTAITRPGSGHPGSTLSAMDGASLAARVLRLTGRAAAGAAAGGRRP